MEVMMLPKENTLPYATMNYVLLRDVSFIPNSIKVT